MEINGGQIQQFSNPNPSKFLNTNIAPSHVLKNLKSKSNPFQNTVIKTQLHHFEIAQTQIHVQIQIHYIFTIHYIKKVQIQSLMEKNDVPMKFACKLVHGGQCTFVTDLSGCPLEHWNKNKKKRNKINKRVQN